MDDSSEPDPGNTTSESDARSAPDRASFRIVETDGDVVELVATATGGEIRVITSMIKEGNDLVLDGLHIDGPGSGTIGVSGLRALARSFGRERQAKRVIVRGGVRSTGASPGRVPRPIVIVVEPADGSGHS